MGRCRGRGTDYTRFKRRAARDVRDEADRRRAPFTVDCPLRAKPLINDARGDLLTARASLSGLRANCGVDCVRLTKLTARVSQS